MSNQAGTELNAFSSMAAEQANAELRSVQFKAVTAFSRLRDDVGKLGSAADTLDLRHRIGQSSDKFKELAQDFKQRVAQHPAKDSTAAQKLLRDFQGLLKNFERLMETARAKEAGSMPRPSAAQAAAVAAAAAGKAESGRSREAQEEQERQALLEGQRKQAMLRIDNELVFNEAIIEEREHAINEISGQIGEVHQIFQDLAVLVNDQGEQLNDIEANITRAAERTGDATVQIQKAERLQRKTRNTWCFLMLICMGVLGVLLLILLA
ncbi:hypothetical protein N2152v2_009007 [Parachlorella kessleri]